MSQESIFTLMNTFTPRGEAVEPLLRLQLEEMAKLRGTAGAAGWLDNEVYRAKDRNQLVVVTRFRSEAAKNDWAQSPEFAEHLKQISPLVAHVDSVPVDLVRTFQNTEDTAPLRLAVINGSTREGRFSDRPASWIAAKARDLGGFAVSDIDLRDIDLPFFGDPRASAAQQQAAAEFAPKMAAFDAYIFTVAEYNHAPTAVLKNALDHGGWKRKPAGFVGYGGLGAARAVEHLRGIAAELEMVTMQTGVHINFPEYLAVAGGEKTLADFTHLEEAAQKMLQQLHWWARTLRAGRAVELAA